MTDDETISLEELTPDTRNANKGTARGRGMIERSLERLGAGRSIVVDRRMRIIAGNKTHEVATQLGLKGRIVRTRGDELAIVVREDLDLDDERARELAYADNRAGQVSLAWDLEQIAVDIDNGTLDEVAIDAYALDELLSHDPLPVPGDAEIDETTEMYGVVVECDDDEAQRLLLDRLIGEGYRCRALLA